MRRKDKTGRNLMKILYILVLLSLAAPFNLYAMGTAQHKAQPDALILLITKDYTVDPGGNYTLRLHVKTRINTYKGRKSWADFRARYNSAFETIKVIDAKTTTSKGEVIPVTAKEIHDITDPATQSASLFSASRLKVVNFPSVEEGCTVELILEKKSRLGLWSMEPFSLGDPVRKKIVSVSIPASMNLSVHLLSKDVKQTRKQQGERIVYTWQAYNRPRHVPDPMMPPVENRSDTLLFSTLNSWEEVADFFNKRLLPQKEASCKDITADIVGKAPTAREIFLFIKKRIEVFPIGFFRSSLNFSPACTTLKRGYGSQMDALILFAGLLRQKGIPFQIIAVNASRLWMKGLRDCFDPALFDTFLIKANGKFYSFDMKEAPPGITGLDGQLGLNLQTLRLEPIRDTLSQAEIQTFNIEMASPGSYYADYTGSFLGLKAISLKKTFKDLTSGEFRIRQSMYYHSLNPVAQPVSTLTVSGIEPGSVKVVIRAKYKVSNLVLENNGLFFFPVQAPAIVNSLFGLPPQRKNPLFIRRPLAETVKIKVKLPKGLTAIQVPRDLSGSIGPFSWKYSCHLSGQLLQCQKDARVQRGFLENGKEFERLREIVNRLVDPRLNSFVFRQSPF